MPFSSSTNALAARPSCLYISAKKDSTFLGVVEADVVTTTIHHPDAWTRTPDSDCLAPGGPAVQGYSIGELSASAFSKMCFPTHIGTGHEPCLVLSKDEVDELVVDLFGLADIFFSQT